MIKYLVTNLITGEKREAEADSAKEACDNLGWMIGYCIVKPLGLAERKEKTQ